MSVIEKYINEEVKNSLLQERNMLMKSISMFNAKAESFGVDPIKLFEDEQKNGNKEEKLKPQNLSFPTRTIANSYFIENGWDKLADEIFVKDEAIAIIKIYISDDFKSCYKAEIVSDIDKMQFPLLSVAQKYFEKTGWKRLGSNTFMKGEDLVNISISVSDDLKSYYKAVRC